VIVWIDEQLSPALGPWLTREFGVSAHPVRDLGMHRATDLEIFLEARRAGAVVITKDQDFVSLLERNGPPPRVLLVTCGNTSNAHLRAILSRVLPAALASFAAGETLVEISDAR
jgi:predicted nuclease of predicted toxin-antitoxin system